MLEGSAGWGLGMSVAIERTMSRLTLGRLGWDGDYGTSACLDPQTELIAIFLSQCLMDWPEPPQAYLNLWRLAYEAVA